MTLAPSRRPWPGALEPLWSAARAFWNEAVGFRFDYPLETVPSAGSRESLRYYVYSDRLFFDAMQLDPAGIPVHRSRIFGETYNPAYVAWHGLVSLERWLRGADPGGARAFSRQAEQVLSGGRPVCTYCGLPIDPAGHPCPASNGSRPIF